MKESSGVHDHSSSLVFLPVFQVTSPRFQTPVNFLGVCLAVGSLAVSRKIDKVETTALVRETDGEGETDSAFRITCARV